MSRITRFDAFRILTLIAFVASTAQADLVGLWRFDEAVNPQPDSSEYNNSAEVIEATWMNDPERGGVMFFEGFGDGVQEQYLEVEDSDSLSIEDTGITIAAWANFAQFDTWNSIMGKTGVNAQNQPSPYDLYTMNNGSGILRFYVGEAEASIAFSDSESPPEAEIWQHIAVTMDEEGEVTHYLNGEINGEGFIDRFSNPLVDQDMNLFIGSRLDGTTNMDGALDDVAIFNETLTPEQILLIMSGDFSPWTGGVEGDFNGNGELDAEDIDLLSDDVLSPSGETRFDLNKDGSVDQADRTVWVHDLKMTWFGDANLDGEFDSGDLVQSLASGQYEDAVVGNSGWASGDFNGDKEFLTTDLVTALSDGGYENGPRPAAGVAAVPEPASGLLLLSALLPLVLRRR